MKLALLFYSQFQVVDDWLHVNGFGAVMSQLVPTGTARCSTWHGVRMSQAFYLKIGHNADKFGTRLVKFFIYKRLKIRSPKQCVLRTSLKNPKLTLVPKSNNLSLSRSFSSHFTLILLGYQQKHQSPTAWLLAKAKFNNSKSSD